MILSPELKVRPGAALGKLQVAPARELEEDIVTFFQWLTPRKQAASIWQAPGAVGEKYLRALIGRSALGGLLLDGGGTPIAAALCEAAVEGAGTAALHFIAGPPLTPLLISGSQQFLRHALEAYLCLTAALPRQWYGTRRLLELLGFTRGETLPLAMCGYRRMKPVLMDMVCYYRKR